MLLLDEFELFDDVLVVLIKSILLYNFKKIIASSAEDAIIILFIYSFIVRV